MQRVQRRLGKARTADDSQVSVLMKDFDDADQMLQRLIEAAKTWRDAWRDIFLYQERLLIEFHGLYKHIPGAGPDHVAAHDYVQTPQENLDRVARLQEAYSDLKNDMLDEVNMMDSRIIRPALDARDAIAPIKKVIKRRQDRKLDFERAQSKFDANTKKMNRTDKERVALAKSESDFAVTKQEYEAADDRLRESLPPLIQATLNLLPELLNSQILIQNNLLGHYYTQLHNYCSQEGFPSPPPPMTDVISVWQSDFLTLQQQVETGFQCIANGKAVRMPFKSEKQPSLGVGNGVRTVTRQKSPSAADAPRSPAPKPSPSAEPEYVTRVSSVPSQGSLALSTPNYGSALVSPSSDTTTPHAPAGPRQDYFSRERSASSQFASAAAQKKRPPPPPPKRNASSQAMWVTALYDFAGQGQGDLAFREGDRIKVIKKTESTDDWWEGELGGVRGPFPANYCRA